jgi:sugar lactone lactonase YvrE
MLHEITSAGPVCTLGEGPRWDPERQRLLWVDINNGLLLQATLDSDSLGEVTTEHVAPTVGAFAVGADGNLLVAAHDRLIVLEADGTRRESGTLVPAGHRFNDGAVDPDGRFLVGTLSLGETTWDDRLIRLEHDGTVTVLDDDLGLSNGLAWSRLGNLFYSVDSERHMVFVREYEPSTGRTGERHAFVSVTDGYPDGICVDAEDHIWVAVWGAGAVHRYSPGGQLVAVVDIPAPHTTAVAFAGPRCDLMVVTSATEGLTPQETIEYPASGQLFLLPATTPGVTGTPWRTAPLPDTSSL